MIYKPVYVSPTYYVFRDQSGSQYFVGIFGTVAVGPVTIMMNELEISAFESRGEKYLAELYSEIDFHTDKYRERFLNHVEKDPGVIEIIRINSFTPIEKPTLFSRIRSFLGL